MLNFRGGQRSSSDNHHRSAQVATNSSSSGKSKIKRQLKYGKVRPQNITILFLTAAVLFGWLYDVNPGSDHDHDSSLSFAAPYLSFNGTDSSGFPALQNTQHVRRLVSYESFESMSGNISIARTSRPIGTGTGTSSAHQCKQNAVVILVQKEHATYHRDSYGMLLNALDLLAKNYISIGNHSKNMDIFLFHTGDFDEKDLIFLESSLNTRPGILKLVNLNGTAFWTLPSWHDKDDRSHWIDADIFPVGYRHMCRWFGVKIWQFFEEMNAALDCNYRHLLRIDEDSLILSPIHYDIFDYMLANKFVYGFRLCAYELEYNRRIAPWLNNWKMKNPMKREMHRDLCGFYNNFFVADLQFFTSAPVKRYLKTLDRQGFIYRKRYGDLMIHSTTVYAFAESYQIHRFLDFTYSHVTRDILRPEQGCVVWGGIQAGYADPNREKTLDEYYQKSVRDLKCTANSSYISEKDLSPTYQHIPGEWKGKVTLKTIMAGKVELPSQGVNSG